MTDEKTQTDEKKEKVATKPLPVDKEKANAIEKGEFPATAPETPKTEGTLEEKLGSKEEKKETKEPKKEQPKISKKEEAIATTRSAPISKKHCMYLCKFIKNKKIDQALKDLNDVLLMKRAVPFKGEIPHRKGKMMSGRYPIKATQYFISLLKALKGNVIVNQMELEETRIYSASANWATRPMRTGGRLAKRTHITVKAKELRSPQRESPQRKRGASQQERVGEDSKEAKK